MTGDSHLSTHPPLPPTTEDDRVAWVRLLRSSRIGPATFFKLLSEQGSAEAALAHLPERANEVGLTESSPCPAAVARAELKRGRAAGARPVFFGSAEYPSALNDLPDPPPMLWIKGDATLLARPTLSLIGARTVSSLGLRMARRPRRRTPHRNCRNPPRRDRPALPRPERRTHGQNRRQRPHHR